ncbi:MAG: restriction endonuclease [Candidatus Thermoplasmatota archaeon]|nr:restriction endonuclease [Candidatus Thermoplasmatota archaeon]
MAIPDYERMMLPFLKFAGDGKEHSIREATDHISKVFNLTDDERKALLPSGQQPIVDNRVGWARTYMKKAGLLISTKRSYFKITDVGLDVLRKTPSEINVKYLEQFPLFIEFKNFKRQEKEDKGPEPERYSQQTPQEAFEYGYQKIRQDLAQELLNTVKSCSPEFFEKLVLDLITKMGYGGFRSDASEIRGKVGDEGIDGIINEDKLGLDVIYIQAKRWDGTVGRPEIQKFVGALAGQGAKKGIFITTGKFSGDARGYVPRNDVKIVLIDGEELSNFMIDHNVGTSTDRTYEIKKMDSDYFVEE